jgi:hypothetical protein
MIRLSADVPLNQAHITRKVVAIVLRGCGLTPPVDEGA